MTRGQDSRKILAIQPVLFLGSRKGGGRGGQKVSYPLVYHASGAKKNVLSQMQGYGTILPLNRFPTEIVS